jgi:glycosyltransferase involved in cell wall biosynthesis
MNSATPPAPEPATIDPDYSPWRVLRFRLRQTLVWWIHTAFKAPLGMSLVIAGMALRALGLRQAGLKYLLLGRRVAPSARADAAIWRIVENDDDTRSEFDGLLIEAVKKAVHADRILILKVPRLEVGEVIEKGALIVKFSETFAPLFHELDVRRLAQYFRIILEPSSVGYSGPEILVWTQLRPEKVVVLAPYQPDFDFLRPTQSNLLPVTLGPGDWVNPARFFESGRDKVYDAICIANFNPIKRVDRFLRAVVRVNKVRPEYKAALVCAGLGKNTRHGRDILATIAWAQGRAALDFFGSMNQQRLNELINESKVNVVVSLREGGPKCLAEGLFAGTPAVLIAETVCGHQGHIAHESGRLARDSELESTLQWFSDHHNECRPREWAEKHISPIASTRELSRVVRELELAEGFQWTTDLIPKMNQPELAYVNSSDEWLLPWRVALLAAFGKSGSSASAREFLRSLSTAESESRDNSRVV